MKDPFCKCGHPRDVHFESGVNSAGCLRCVECRRYVPDVVDNVNWQPSTEWRTLLGTSTAVLSFLNRLSEAHFVICTPVPWEKEKMVQPRAFGKIYPKGWSVDCWMCGDTQQSNSASEEAFKAELLQIGWTESESRWTCPECIAATNAAEGVEV